jgi:diguanylate cyclase (GGDEF)-like protein
MGYPSIPFEPGAPAQHALQQRVGMLQALLDGLFEAACVVDGGSLTIIGLNVPMLQLFGLTAPQLLGQPVDRIACSPEDHHFWLAAHGALDMGLLSMDTHARLHSDTLVRQAQGSVVNVERRIVPIELPSGHAGWLVTWLDDAPKRALQAELDRLSATWDAELARSRDALLVTDRSGAVRGCSRSFVALLGLPEHTPATDPDLVQRLHQLAAQPRQCRERWQAVLDDPRATWTERLPLADGRLLEWHTAPQYARGELIGRLHAWRDLTPELQAAARQRIASEVFDSVLDAIFVVDQHLRIAHLNRTAAQLCPATVCHGQPLADWLFDPNDPEHLMLALQSLEQQSRWQGELLLRSPGGTLPVRALLVPVDHEGVHAGRYLVMLQDLRERHAQQLALHQLSLCDPLTGLANRLGFAERVEAALATNPGHGVAVMAIGLNRFTQINDSLGPRAGDGVLVDVAQRLQATLGPNDLLGRLGGDTFVVLLSQGDAAAAEALARRALAALHERFTAAQIDFSVQSSVGIALYPGDGQTADELIKNADSAMHDVKQRVGGDLRFYQPRMNTELLGRMRLDHAMRIALREQRFELHFQPQFDLQHGGLVGAEALLRWHDPELGQVGPDQFIPVAEETGFIIELGDFVLRDAIRRAAEWRRQGARIPVAVNISALQFQQDHFAEHLIELLQAQALPGELLELELTESVLAYDLEAIAAQLHRLAAHGVKLAIDDFGTGYASLGYLKQLPLHRLKIDRSFVQGLPADASDAAIVRSVIQMARDLHLRVVAEGVENEAQAKFLADAGCHEAQGFLYARPMHAARFETHFAHVTL